MQRHKSPGPWEGGQGGREKEAERKRKKKRQHCSNHFHAQSYYRDSPDSGQSVIKLGHVHHRRCVESNAIAA